VREYTKAKLDKDDAKLKEVQSIIVDFFSEGKLLKEELMVYKAIIDTKEIDKDLAERILAEAKRVYSFLNKDEVYKAQSALISKINKKLSPKFYSNYVPNYKNLATLQQIFTQKTDIPSRMLLERQVLEIMTSPKETIQEINEKIDKYVIHSFLNAFNKKYSDLLPEQKMLLKKYMITSEEDNTDFTVFVNEEMQKISMKLKTSFDQAEVKEDNSMVQKLKEVKNRFESLKECDMDEKFLQKLLKYQKLIYELEN
jgi:hypothetical protein